MGTAEPQQPRRHASSEIQFEFLVEGLVRSAQLDVGEQLSPLVVSAREQSDHLLAVLVHFVLLRLGSNQDGSVWKTGHAPGMLGMKVCRRQIKLVVGRKSFRHFRDRGAIARPQTGVDDQRCVFAHDDPDIRPTHDGPDVIRHLHGVFAQETVMTRNALRGRRGRHKAKRHDRQEDLHIVHRDPFDAVSHRDRECGDQEKPLTNTVGYCWSRVILCSVTRQCSREVLARSRRSVRERPLCNEQA